VAYTAAVAVTWPKIATLDVIGCLYRADGTERTPAVLPAKLEADCVDQTPADLAVRKLSSSRRSLTPREGD
jgi:hypothetical protein